MWYLKILYFVGPTNPKTYISYFFKVTTWAGFIYFFTPIMFIIVANIIMFVMTALKIHRVQREMARIMAKEDSTRNLKKEKDKYISIFICLPQKVYSYNNF